MGIKGMLTCDSLKGEINGDFNANKQDCTGFSSPFRNHATLRISMGKHLESMHMDGCIEELLLVQLIWSWTILLGSMSFGLLAHGLLADKAILWQTH